jgi:hypothetical protein
MLFEFYALVGRDRNRSAKASLVNQPPDDVLRRYLLGFSNEAECDEVEGVYLSDAAEYERLEAAEDELIEDYLDGQLDTDQRRGFEHYFLNAAERRKNLDFARALRVVVSRTRSETRGETLWERFASWFKAPALGWTEWAAGAALAVAVVGCGLLFLQNRHLGMGYSVARIERQDLAEQNDKLRRELQASVQRSAPPAASAPYELGVISAVLSPGLTRSGGGSRRILIPPRADLAKLKLELFTSEYQLYRALLRHPDGEEMLSQSNLRPDPRHEVIVLVPTDLLSSGEYQIVLAGRTANGNYEPAATYLFRIVR